MARIAGVDLPRNKRIVVGLTYIFGVGRSKSEEILKATGVSESVRVHELLEEDENKIRDYINANVEVEGDLRRSVAMDIKRLEDINSYRGTRHRKGLPVRGQRSKTNARTRKGPKRTQANKKK